MFQFNAMIHFLIFFGQISCFNNFLFKDKKKSHQISLVLFDSVVVDLSFCLKTLIAKCIFWLSELLSITVVCVYLLYLLALIVCAYIKEHFFLRRRIVFQVFIILFMQMLFDHVSNLKMVCIFINGHI